MVADKQKGFLEGYLVLAASGALAVAFLGTYWLGGHNREKKLVAAYEAEKTAAIIAADKKRSADLAVLSKIIQEKLDAESQISTLTAAAKGKVNANETLKVCPAAPAGSILVTPAGLRDLKALYGKR